MIIGLYLVYDLLNWKTWRILDKRKVSPIICYLQYKVWHLLITVCVTWTGLSDLKGLVYLPHFTDRVTQPKRNKHRIIETIVQDARGSLNILISVGYLEVCD